MPAADKVPAPRLGAFPAATPAETRALGRAVAEWVAAGDLLRLVGPLGAGKTLLTQGLAEGLGLDPAEVTSPTFILMQRHEGGRLPLVHVDLYRLAGREVENLGLEEQVADAVAAVEWGERLPAGYGRRRFRITIARQGTDRRLITITEEE